MILFVLACDLTLFSLDLGFWCRLGGTHGVVFGLCAARGSWRDHAVVLLVTSNGWGGGERGKSKEQPRGARRCPCSSYDMDRDATRTLAVTLVMSVLVG